MKYRKKPVIIDAIQLNDEYNSICNAIEFVENIDMSTSIIGRNICVKDVQKEKGLIIHNLEGDKKESFGDYIIKGVNGEFYPCKQDVKKKTYELVK